MCSHSVVEWHEGARTFASVDYGREMTEKKSCKYAEYGLFVCMFASIFFLSLLPCPLFESQWFSKHVSES